MEDKPIRVLLDFSEVHSGISGLKYVWMHVSPRELQTINDFKQAIAKKFSFNQEGFKLFVRDGLLLETEKIAILREDDTVKIQLEAPCETSLDCSAVNISASHPSLTSSLNKSCKRKSETFIAASRENGNDGSLNNPSKKKKKQDDTESDESYSSQPEESLNNQSHENSSLKKNSNVSANKDKTNKQPLKGKKKPFPRTPTSEFITFAVKLSQAEQKNKNLSQFNVSATSSPRIRDSISVTNSYKTTEAVSKASLSPIPEQNTYDLSKNNVTNVESLEIEESQAGLTLDKEVASKVKTSSKRRRRKRKRKVIASDESLSVDVVNNEMEGSFLADVKSNETYNASSDTRKHIVFHSPTPPKIATTITLDSISDMSLEESIVQCAENNAELDSSQSEFAKEDSQSNMRRNKVSEFAVSGVEDATKESTPFPKKRSKGKSWDITPLPRIQDNSQLISSSRENNDISRSETAKPNYQECAPLNCLPTVGTRLAYKTLELNEEYCPEVSEYKEGILVKVDPNTDQLEIELVQEEIKHGRSGKFENLWKDEPVPDDEVIKRVSLNWSSLIDPRLIPTN